MPSRRRIPKHYGGHGAVEPPPAPFPAGGSTWKHEIEVFVRTPTTRQQMFRVALRKCRSRPDMADDVVQEAALRAIKKWDLYRPIATMSAWIMTITTNVALDLMKKEDRRQRHEQQLSDLTPTHAMLDHMSHGDVIRALHMSRDEYDLVQADKKEVKERASAENVTEGAIRKRKERKIKEYRARLYELGYMPTVQRCGPRRESQGSGPRRSPTELRRT
jgi:RNA polymerase sigma-70 factor (ECF subfamily)